MTITEAIEIVRKEAAFRRRLVAKAGPGPNALDDFASVTNRRAEAQETVVAEIERLRNDSAIQRQAIEAAYEALGIEPELQSVEGLVAAVEGMRKELGVAQSIISKIPKTEDGVTILPGAELFHILCGTFADGSQAYETAVVTWLGWHDDRRKRQQMYFSVEDCCDYYDGKGWFVSEYEMFKAIGDDEATNAYLLEQSMREVAEAAKENHEA